MASADQISCRNLGRQSWASAPTPCGGRHAGVVVPYGWLRRAAAIARASGAQRSVCASGCEEMSGNRGKDYPQSVQQRWTIPQSRLRRDSSLYTREPLGTGVRAAEVVDLYGKPNHPPPSQPARSEASAPAWARDGRESTQEPSQKGATAATATAALSEAESAERAAGQIRSLPDD